MKILGNLSVVKETNVNMPFGATIQNETETQEGTPVVREILGDILMNLYRLLELAGITPTNTEDSDITQYQIVEALKMLPNSLNDTERILSLNTTIWSTDLKLSVLPNKYFFIARASDDYVPSINYTFKGIEPFPSYGFTSDGFSASDEVLVIIDNTNVRVYSLSNFKANTDILLPLGNPLSFNDTNQVMYHDEGKVYTDLPSSNQLETTLRTFSTISNLKVKDVYILKGFVLCFCFSPDDDDYLFYQFSISDLTTPESIDVSTIIGRGTDYDTYCFTDGSYLYLTNSGNNSASDYSIIKLLYNPIDVEITSVSSFSIDTSFVKTYSSCVKTNNLYTFESGTLSTFNLSTGIKTILGVYTNVIGRIFNFNGRIYFSSGKVAKKWTL